MLSKLGRPAGGSALASVSLNLWRHPVEVAEQARPTSAAKVLQLAQTVGSRDEHAQAKPVPEPTFDCPQALISLTIQMTNSLKQERPN